MQGQPRRRELLVAAAAVLHGVWGTQGALASASL
mgnify:CR=1 FL=1